MLMELAGTHKLSVSSANVVHEYLRMSTWEVAVKVFCKLTHEYLTAHATLVMLVLSTRPA